MQLLREHPGLALAKAPAIELLHTHWVYAGDSALHVAAACHQAALVGRLLALGADPGALNRRDAGPLHYAADGLPDHPRWDPQAQAKVISLLLRAGADPGAKDKGGATPLHRAVRTRCSLAVKTLLKAGASPRTRNHAGSTPLKLTGMPTGRGGSGSVAAKREQTEILRLLKRAMKVLR